MVVSLFAFAGCGGQPQTPGEPAEQNGTVPKETTEEAGAMDVRDAVGQMFIVGLGGTEPDYYIEKMVRERSVGGVLLLGHTCGARSRRRASRTPCRGSP